MTQNFLDGTMLSYLDPNTLLYSAVFVVTRTGRFNTGGFNFPGRRYAPFCWTFGSILITLVTLALALWSKDWVTWGSPIHPYIILEAGTFLLGLGFVLDGFRIISHWITFPLGILGVFAITFWISMPGYAVQITHKLM